MFLVHVHVIHVSFSFQMLHNYVTAKAAGSGAMHMRYILYSISAPDYKLVLYIEYA